MELKVKNRIILGKKVKHLRDKGLIPAELFGHGVTNKHLEIPEKDLIDIYKKAGSHTIIQVITEEGEKIPALISEVQHHPLSRKPLNVDLHQIRMDEIIETGVPIKFKGEAPVEKSGFFVMRVLDEIEIKALPDKIPHSFEVDLSTLKEVGQSINVNDITVPKEVKILTPGETVIATVTEREKEEEETSSPAAEATEVTAKTTPETTETPSKPTEAEKKKEPEKSKK
ncbi:MAG: 50S ribosomal protein L25 [Patescibacteria group bacterium]|nr:50S ribosomal protein L25 [Patescibacteria group bacterium]